MENYGENENALEKISGLFGEFCRGMGIKAKFRAEFEKDGAGCGGNDRTECRLVIENIVPGQSDTAKKIAAIKADTRNAIAEYGAVTMPDDCKAQKLTSEFNAFLKGKGLAGKYSVRITEE